MKKLIPPVPLLFWPITQIALSSVVFNGEVTVRGLASRTQGTYVHAKRKIQVAVDAGILEWADSETAVLKEEE